MSQRIEMPWGYVDIGMEDGKNEVIVVSTVGDPPKIKFASPEGISLGAFSFCRLRADGSGKMDEMVLFQGKQDERTRDNPSDQSGEFTLHINDGSNTGDAAMVPVIQARHDGVLIKGINW